MWFSFRPPFGMLLIKVQVTLRDQTVESPYLEPPDNSKQKSAPLLSQKL